MPKDRTAPDPETRRRWRWLAWVLLVVSLVLVGAAIGLLVQQYRLRLAPDQGVPRETESRPLEPQTGSPPDDCHTAATDALGLGRKGFASEPEAIAALGDMLLFPDPNTLPDDAVFAGVSYHANMKGSFRLFIIGLRYESEKTPLEILIFNLERYDGPVEEHTPVSVRGKDGFLFQPPFGEDIHAVMWREGCPWVSVTARLPADDVLAIAAGLHPPQAPANEATTGPSRD